MTSVNSIVPGFRVLCKPQYTRFLSSTKIDASSNFTSLLRIDSLIEYLVFIIAVDDVILTHINKDGRKTAGRYFYVEIRGTFGWTSIWDDELIDALVIECNS